MTAFYQIKIKSIHKESLVLYKIFLCHLLSKLEIKYTLINLPKKIKKITLLKSPHVHKRAREQFQILKRKISINLISFIKPKVLAFLIFNTPKTIKIKINKF